MYGLMFPFLQFNSHFVTIHNRKRLWMFFHSEMDSSDSLNAWLKIINKILNFVLSGDFQS